MSRADKGWTEHLQARPGRRIALAVGAAAIALLVLVSTAQAAKQPVDFFGGAGSRGGQFQGAAGVAVNYTGAGGVPVGTTYVTDGGDFDRPGQRGNRVERFQREDGGTPGDASDDTYAFVSAWGAGVETGGTDFEICTGVDGCGLGTGEGGNGALAGDGALSKPSGIAVDQDTGNVYVVDASARRASPDSNFRINVYDATGHFLRSFGFDVVASGPDDNGTGYEICVAGVDVCKAGLAGSGNGQIGAVGTENVAQSIAISTPDGNPATGTVFLADRANRRIGTFALDGTSPSSIGSAAVFGTDAPKYVAVDSRGIVYASDSSNNEQIERYDSENADGGGVGFLAPISSGVDEVQTVTVSATAGTFKLIYAGEATVDLPFNAPAQDPSLGATPEIDSVAEALRALPAVRRATVDGGAGVVSVTGGPGNATGSAPYRVKFSLGLGATDVPQMTAANGATPLSGGSGASVTTTTPGATGLIPAPTSGLSVDPDSDGAGPDSDVLYVSRGSFGSLIQQFGPLNAPGLSVPPSADDERHGESNFYRQPEGLAVEPPTGRLLVAAGGLSSAGPGVYVLDTASPVAPTATLDSLTDPTDHSLTAHATIDPNGPPVTRYHFEYSADGTNWSSLPEVMLGSGEDPQSIVAAIEPAPFGLEPSTTYRVRLVAGRMFSTPITTPALTATTLAAKPLLETTGTPLRTASTAQLQARVNPRNLATTYWFEYGLQGPCDSNPCVSTPVRSAGAGGSFAFVSEEIDGLEPGATYHYRVRADNGAGGPSVAGGDRTVTTRASDAPLSHGPYPGPAGSDRAWEQVNMPDTGGNPVSIARGFSDDGDRAVYGVIGGTPLSDTGSLISLYVSERPAGQHPQSGWRVEPTTPPRSELGSSGWPEAYIGPGDLSSMIAINGLGVLNAPPVFWRLSPGHQPVKLFEPIDPQTTLVGGQTYLEVSDDGSKAIVMAKGGTLDPAYPAAASLYNLYDIGSGSPRLVSQLPGNAVAPCSLSNEQAGNVAPASTHWVRDDRVFFTAQAKGPCQSAPFSLYMRDLGAGQTTRLSPAGCDARLAKTVPSGAFFVCAGEVYRYDFAEATSSCLTCSLDGSVASVLVSDDGSRLYFNSSVPLVPGAPAAGTYRLETKSGSVAYVATGVNLSESALIPDGAELFFRSSSPTLNHLGGSINGGKAQFYRYDDRDRSLVCVTCPSDGSAPLGDATARTNGVGALTRTSNMTSLAANGTFAFATPTPLVDADQNTPSSGPAGEAATDIYEWRDGRQMLVTDGLTSWPRLFAPEIRGINPSGRDLFFSAAAQYTPDALDDFRRLYDARIGGGIDFPAQPKPCPLEVCQGTPKGAPAEQQPGTSNYSGPGNAAKKVVKKKKAAKKKAVKKKRAAKKRHHKKRQHRKPSQNRRASR